MELKVKCTWCSASNFRKVGTRKTRQGIKQMYLCKECQSKFTDGTLIPYPKPEPAEKMPRFTYPQNWEAYNQAQTEEGRLFRQILFELSTRAEQEKRKVGRPRAEVRDLVFSICSKIYTGFSGRRLISDLEYSYAMDYLSHVPHFNMLFKAMNSEQITPVLQELIRVSSFPAKILEDTYAIDSTGVSTSMFSRWMEKKYGKDKEQKKRIWVKAHAMVGVKTKTIVSMEVTLGNKGDSPQFIQLLEKGKEGAKILDVCADKAYSSPSQF